MKVLLAGDIGGSKTYLGLFIEEGGAVREVRARKFINSRFSGLEEMVRLFLRGAGPRPLFAAFGVAGPVRGERCSLTNIPWVIDARLIKKRFGLKGVWLLNDIAAIGWGLGLLEREDLLEVNKGKKRDGNRCLVAAGTGLGEAVLFWDGASHVPVSTEGGHSDFAPRTPLEMELLGYLARIYGHVSYERVLSGPGIEKVYGFLAERGRVLLPRFMKKRLAAGEAAPLITKKALSGSDALARETLELFMSVYGAEAGNAALKSMALGGVFVGGGIAPQVFRDPGLREMFIESFADKGRFRGLMREVPVHVILEEKAALIGAAYRASKVGD